MIKLIKKPLRRKAAKTETIEAWLLVGLGNPGDGYKNNRHNIGFMAVDAIAKEHKFPPFKAKFEGLMTEGTIEGQKVILLKPQTYMNNSGQSVKAAKKFFKLKPDHVVVFHDELDLPPGKLRAKLGGGNAGHNGLKSVEAHLGTPEYWRVRLGIGHPGERAKVEGHVLKDFAKADGQWLQALIGALSEHAALILQGGDLASYIIKVAAAVPACAAESDEKGPEQKASAKKISADATAVKPILKKKAKGQ